MTCAAKAEQKCEQTCQQFDEMQILPASHGIKSESTSFNPESTWGTLAPTTYSSWISQIESLNIMEPHEMKQIAEQSRSSPNDLFLLLNKHIKTRARLSQPTRQTLEMIFQQLDRCCRPAGGWTKSYKHPGLLQTSECFVYGANKPAVPTIVYSQWIKQLRDLGLLSNKEICEAEDFARSKPDKLIEMMNMVSNERGQIISSIKRDKLQHIITDVSRYTSLGNPKNLPSNYFVNIPMKITTWRKKIEEMSQIESVQKSLLRNLEVIMTSAKTASDSYTMIQEMRALLPQLVPEAKDNMGKLLIDVKRSVLKQKLAQLLTNYDSDIDVKTKQKLANIIIVEEKFGNQQAMMTQMHQMMTVVQKLMVEEILPKQLISELYLCMSRLGVELDEDARISTVEFYGGIQKYISINELLSMLTSHSSATFPVPNKEACNLEKFCQRR